MKNVGTADRIVRVIADLVIGAAGIYFKSWWGLIALGPLLTASIGFCPAYLPLGISTCRVKHE